MKLHYTYHSEHHAGSSDRWVHFFYFAGAITLLLFGGYRLFHHLTDWSSEELATPWLQYALTALFLIGGLVLAYVAASIHSHREMDRFVRIDEDKIQWHLLQDEKEQKVPLKKIERFEAPNVRELLLYLEGGIKVSLPFYLITTEEKQEELVATLKELIDKE